MWHVLDAATRRETATSQSTALRVKSTLEPVWIGLATLAVLVVAAACGLVSLALVDWIIMLALLVLTPQALALLDSPGLNLSLTWLLRFVRLLQPAAALLAIAAWLAPQGALSAACAAPWFLLTILIADVGAASLVQGGWRRPESLAAALGMLFVPIGGAWLVLWRFGAWPGGYDPIIAQLTVVHFHYAGLFLPVVLSQVIVASRETNLLRPAAANMLVVTIAAATLLLALGITWSPTVEIVAAWLLVAAGVAVGIWQAVVACRMATASPRDRSAAGLLLASSTALLSGLALAAIYAAGEFQQRPTLTIEQMIPLHGLAMSLGFALCGLTGWGSVTHRRLAHWRCSAGNT